MPVAVGDTIEVKLWSTVGSQTAINVLHYYVNAVGGLSIEPADIAAAMAGVFAAPMKALLSVKASYHGTSAQKIWPLLVGAQAVSVVGAGVGGVAGDALPLQVAGVISKRTPFAGRAQRGRFYMPFPGEGDSDANGQPTAGYLVNLLALANLIDNVQAIAVGADSANLTPIIWHRGSHTVTAMTQAIIRTVWGTQRRRGDFGQHNLPPF